MVGPESSGRTSLALSFIAQMTRTGKVCAWVDVSNTLHPESAAASDVDLSRLLWVLCGVQVAPWLQLSQTAFTLPEKYLIPPPIKKGLHGGGFGPHPRNEVKGLSDAVSGLLRSETFAPRCAEPQRKERPEKKAFEPNLRKPSTRQSRRPDLSHRPWSRLDQAIRVTDLLLQGGGFGGIVLDMASAAPEHASRVPLATWFRFRAAAEKTQASIVLLTQHSCAKSSGECCCNAMTYLLAESPGSNASRILAQSAAPSAEIVVCVTSIPRSAIYVSIPRPSVGRREGRQLPEFLRCHAELDPNEAKESERIGTLLLTKIKKFGDDSKFCLKAALPIAGEYSVADRRVFYECRGKEALF
jgi:hypothetical protein